MEQTIKPGDFVRLTDPLDNGTIVRIENVDENGFAEWLGGSQNSDMEQIDLIGLNSDLIYYYHSLSELVRHIEEKTGIKLYPESAVQYWKHRAEKAEAENALNEKLLDKEHNKLLDAHDYIKKVCKESSADIQRLDAENKELKNQKSIQQLWKEMRLEFCCQTSGGGFTKPTFDEYDKMYSLNDIDYLIENLNEEQAN